MDKQKRADFEKLTTFWELRILEWKMEKLISELVVDSEILCNAE